MAGRKFLRSSFKQQQSKKLNCSSTRRAVDAPCGGGNITGAILFPAPSKYLLKKYGPAEAVNRVLKREGIDLQITNKKS